MGANCIITCTYPEFESIDRGQLALHVVAVTTMEEKQQPEDSKHSQIGQDSEGIPKI